MTIIITNYFVDLHSLSQCLVIVVVFMDNREKLIQSLLCHNYTMKLISFNLITLILHPLVVVFKNILVI